MLTTQPGPRRASRACVTRRGLFVVSPRRAVVYWPQKGSEMMSMLKNYSDFEVHYALSLASALFADYLRTTPSASAQQKADAFNQCLEGALTNAKLFTAERNEN